MGPRSRMVSLELISRSFPKMINFCLLGNLFFTQVLKQRLRRTKSISIRISYVSFHYKENSYLELPVQIRATPVRVGFTCPLPSRLVFARNGAAFSLTGFALSWMLEVLGSSPPTGFYGRGSLSVRVNHKPHKCQTTCQSSLFEIQIRVFNVNK